LPDETAISNAQAGYGAAVGRDLFLRRAKASGDTPSGSSAACSSSYPGFAGSG
jgi:hypothetical protein